MLKNIMIGVTGVLFIAVSAFFVFLHKGGVPGIQDRSVHQERYHAGSYGNRVISAVTVVCVCTQVSSTIKTLYLGFNSRVKKGGS